MGFRCDLDSQTWIMNSQFMSGSPVFGGTKTLYQLSGAGLTPDLTTYNPNNWNEQTILVPILPLMSRADDKASILGNTVHSRLTNVRNHNIGDIITLGADKWMVFPHLIKGTANLRGYSDSTNGNSGLLGFAIKYDGV